MMDISHWTIMDSRHEEVQKALNDAISVTNDQK